MLTSHQEDYLAMTATLWLSICLATTYSKMTVWRM